MPRRIADSSHIRVSDHQRDGAAAQLREHFSAGRLTEEELSERVQAAYGAKTVADLDALLDDLPALPLSPAELKAQRVERRRRIRRRAIEETTGSFCAFGVCTVIWAAAGAHGYFWPVWVAIAPAAALFRNVPRLIGISSEDDESEAGSGSASESDSGSGSASESGGGEDGGEDPRALRRAERRARRRELRGPDRGC